MAPLKPPRFYVPLALCVLFLSATRVVSGTPSIPLAYCASVNTNQDFKPFVSEYNSEGRCRDNCTTVSYAFGVIQNFNCWCSNTVPARSSLKSTTDCNMPCPGYPSDWCGGSDIFAYIALGKSPSSTEDGDNTPPATTPVSASEQTSTSVSKQTTTHAVVSTETETVQSTVENTVTVRLPVSLTPESSSSSSTAELSSTNSEPIVQTVTVGGTVKTVTAVPSSTGSGSPPALAESNVSSNGLATGAAVGIAVGVIAALAVVGVFLWMWCIKRRRRNEAGRGGQYDSPSVHGSSGGMMGTPKSPEVSDNRFGSASSGGDGASTWDANGKRRSHLMPIDPRLDPFAKGIYVGSQNKSHESISSLQDNHDYSRRVHQPPRVLRAVNPDPDDD